MSGPLRSPDPIEFNSQQWFIQVFKPGRRPLEAMAVALMAINPATLDRSLRSLIEEMETDEQGLHLLTLEVLAGQSSPDKTHIALVIDQFEEIFTLCDDEAVRRTFLTNLLYAASLQDGRTVVILTMRADFYSQAAMYPNLATQLADQQVLISPMTETALTEAITKPAHKVGLHFEAGLVDRLLQDAAAEPGALPLLQHALLELWERREKNGLTLVGYQASGGVHGALTQRADSVLAALTSPQQDIVRRVMLRLTKLGEGTADTRRRATLSELVRTSEEEDDVRTVVTQLANARLVTTSADSQTDEEVVDVAHEALIRGWSTLQAWLAEDRDALRLHQRLAEAAEEWKHNNRDNSYLYRGARLAAAEEWAETYDAETNRQERDFLAASLAIRAQKTLRRERLRRRTILGLTLGLLVAVGLALLAFSQFRQAEAERQKTLSRQLAAQARDLLGDRLDLALLLSVQANQISDTVDARGSLLAALEASPYLTTFLRGHDDWVFSVAFSPDRQVLASGSADGKIILWDVNTYQPLGSPLMAHKDWVRSVAFSRNGQMLASGSADGTIILWDVSTGQAFGPPLTGHTSFVTDVVFSPDDQVLASSSADGTVIMWDVTTRQPLGPPLTGHTSFVLSVVFSPDGQILASGGADKRIILWDISTYETDTKHPLAHALTGHLGTVSSLAFSPDTREGTGNQILASGSEDQTIILWDVATRQALGPPLAGHQGPVTSLVFGPDGQTLASGSDDRNIILWDVATGQTIERPLQGHTDRVLSLAFSPDGQTIASGSADGTIILWDFMVSLPPDLSETEHIIRVNNVAFSPDGQIVASGSYEGTIMLWDALTGQPVGDSLIDSHTPWVVAFSPHTSEGTGGHTLAAGNSEGLIVLWDVATRQPLDPPLIGHTDDVQSMAFSPDGEMLASASENGEVILWDVTTHQSLGLPLPIVGKSVAFSPDGQTLAIGSSEVILWNVKTGQTIGQPMAGHTDEILSMTFSPDDKILVSGGIDHAIILWDLAMHQPIRQSLTNHADAVTSLSFSPDGRTLASGSWDKTVILWDVATLQPIGPPLTNEDRVWSVAFSPDGRALASGGQGNGKIILRDVSPESWQKQACQMVTRNLTLTEWERYLGGEPYQVTCPNASRTNLNAKTDFTAPTPTRDDLPQFSNLVDKPDSNRVAIIEEFDSGEGFIQTSPNVYVAAGQVFWHIERSGGEQYVYRNIPPFGGNVRLTARGQVDSWTNNCQVRVGIGDGPGSGLEIEFGFFGGGCPANGSVVGARGVTLDLNAATCEDLEDGWLWIESSTTYSAELTVLNEMADLTVEGVGGVPGTVNYEGPYTTLWVGRAGDGDWPECTGIIDTVVVEPLD
jgi:WD40 repeat protein